MFIVNKNGAGLYHSLLKATDVEGICRKYVKISATQYIVWKKFKKVESLQWFSVNGP